MPKKLYQIKLDTVFEGDWKDGVQVPDTAVHDALRFVTALNKRGVMVSWDGTLVNGWPEVTYTSKSWNELKEMVLEHWQDSSLLADIEEV